MIHEPNFWSSNAPNGETTDCNPEDKTNSGSAIRHFSVNACLAPVASLHGMAVTTIEGIGSTRYI